MSRIKTVLLIDNVHMGMGHKGLALLCKQKFRLDIIKLDDSEIVMFLNKGRDKLKILGKQGWVVGYIKTPTGKQLMLDALQYLPQTFGATGFDYDQALKTALEAKLKKQTGTGPLQAYRAMERAGLTARTQ